MKRIFLALIAFVSFAANADIHGDNVCASVIVTSQVTDNMQRIFEQEIKRPLPAKYAVSLIAKMTQISATDFESGVLSCQAKMTISTRRGMHKNVWKFLTDKYDPTPDRFMTNLDKHNSKAQTYTYTVKYKIENKQGTFVAWLDDPDELDLDMALAFVLGADLAPGTIPKKR